MKDTESNKMIIEKWSEFENISSEVELLSLAAKIGEIVLHPNGQKIDNLTPNYGGNRIKGTFSNRFGLKEFPFHSDTAFWSIPARYLILSSFAKNDTSTFLVDNQIIFNQMSRVDLKNAANSIYLIKTIHGQIYSSVMFKKNGVTGFKYDPCCMVPINNSAILFQEKLEEVLLDVPRNNINWTGNKAVIIDNWKTLHGRGNIGGDLNRKLILLYHISSFE